MPKSVGKVFEIKCPCCEAILQIDSASEMVINHREVEKKPLIEDLGIAVQQLKGEAARRDDVFEKSFASHRASEQVREKKFEELLRQAKEDPSAPAPKRPFDLD
ncbi:MAG: hypothetical protein ACJ74Y_04385 [Bryobacteraceae bacterium]